MTARKPGGVPRSLDAGAPEQHETARRRLERNFRTSGARGERLERRSQLAERMRLVATNEDACTLRWLIASELRIQCFTHPLRRLLERFRCRDDGAELAAAPQRLG